MSGADEIEKNRLKFNIDWRANKHTYDEQMEQFFMSEELSDIQFVFNDRNGKVTVLVHFTLNFFCFYLFFHIMYEEFRYFRLTNLSFQWGQNSS